MKKQFFAAMLAAIVAVGIGTAAQAQTSDWKFEVTPYVWLAGVDGTLTVGNKSADFDQSFSDIVSNVNVAAEGLAVVQYKQIVGFAQADFFNFRKGSDFNRPNIDDAKLNNTFVTLAAGYQFPGFVKNSTIDVLAAARFYNLDGEVNLVSGASVGKSKTFVDPALVIRPSFQLTEKLRFNPTLSIGGGGDSKLIYELQPQFQYDFTNNIGMRLGYRRLFYKTDNDRNLETEITLSGLIAGVSFLF